MILRAMSQIDERCLGFISRLYSAGRAHPLSMMPNQRQLSSTATEMSHAPASASAGMGIPFPQALSSDQPAAAPLPSIFKTQLSRSASVSRVGSSLIVLREQELLLKNPTKSVKPRVVHTPPPKFYRCSRLRSNTKLFAAMTPDLAAAVAAHARRSRGGYQEFVHQLTQNARQSGTPMRFRHFACAAAAQWRGMSAESRQPFFISAVDSNTSWLQERVMLEARLKQAGHPFLPWDKVSLQPASTPSYLLVKERRAQTKKRQPPEHTQPSVLTEQLAASHSAMCAPSPALPPAQQQLLWQVWLAREVEFASSTQDPAVVVVLVCGRLVQSRSLTMQARKQRARHRMTGFTPCRILFH